MGYNIWLLGDYIKETFRQNNLLTVRARDLKILDNVQHPMCVICPVSHSTCHMSHVTCHHYFQTFRVGDLTF